MELYVFEGRCSSLCQPLSIPDKSTERDSHASLCLKAIFAPNSSPSECHLTWSVAIRAPTFSSNFYSLITVEPWETRRSVSCPLQGLKRSWWGGHRAGHFLLLRKTSLEYLFFLPKWVVLPSFQRSDLHAKKLMPATGIGFTLLSETNKQKETDKI